MSRSEVIEYIESQYKKSKVPAFNVGDTIAVHTRIIEGQKERIQVFAGTVVARKGTGVSETFSLYKVSYGHGVKRVFLLHSPRITKIEVTRFGKVRKAKLYYLVGSSGKKSRVKEHIGGKFKRLIVEEGNDMSASSSNEATT